ncbi:unnamed protein product [Rotaria sp. Silwood1]|nr:unnamed protein product [Rotaria sp. Silwood1]CAF1557747.1 unnamed protein product [Rotaria sp. Silwood1]
MSNNRVAVVSDGRLAVGTGRSVTTNISLGTPEATGKLAWVQNTYASQYNHAVSCWKAFETSGIKRQMRGGHLLLYRWLVLAVVIVAFVLGGLSKNVKPYITFPIVSAVIYLGLTIWNWHVFRTNGNLLHSHMVQVPDSALPGFINEFYTIPIYAQVTDQRLLAISNYTNTVIAQLIEQHHVEYQIQKSNVSIIFTLAFIFLHYLVDSISNSIAYVLSIILK